MQEDYIRKLIYLARLGDVDAIDCLYRLSEQCVYRVYLESQNELQQVDFLSECECEFMHWLKYYCMYAGCSFTTYITVCAQRKIKNLKKNQKRRGQLDIESIDEFLPGRNDSFVDMIAEERIEYNPEGFLHEQEEQIEYQNIVQGCRVGKQTWNIFELYDVGYTPTEISEKLTVPLSTVYNSLFRIRNQIRKRKKMHDEINESTKDV